MGDAQVRRAMAHLQQSNIPPIETRQSREGSTMDLINSKRVLRSASYVAVELSPDEQHRAEREPNRGIEKSNFIRELKITPEVIARVTEALSDRPEFARGWRESLVTLR